MDGIQGFILEKDFEEALIAKLLRHGWNEVIKNPTEADLVRNWADIIYANNRDIDRLGNWPLTEGEMQQILDIVNTKAGDPCEMNRFINGCVVGIRRDNPEDTNNRGKTVYLKIFDPREISAGQSRYQIAQQPRFTTAKVGDRRGDLMLLINGMPVVHIELKRSGIDISQATYQIKRYAHEGVFSRGLYSMVQIFVAMTPEKTLYFANPGREERYNPQFQFHWADFNNTEVRDWQKIASDLLSIPMAHQMLGYYTIADRRDGVLKVLRSYQYFAASKISDTVSRTKWDEGSHRGGFVWHTTGSGKTMTSFKSAQLIAESGDADKVVFLLDRIELAIQTLDNFRGFTDDGVQDTSNSAVLLEKLKSNSPDDRLIVTSIQKMGNLAQNRSIAQADIRQIDGKRLVMIVDECHRSVFGKMLMEIKRTFPRALLFGFTGTPIFTENAKGTSDGEITTETIFGDMLHKYTIADGIPDGNVLGFDPYRVSTYPEHELRETAAFHVIARRMLEEDPTLPVNDLTTDDYLRAKDGNEEYRKIYDRFINTATLMADTYTDHGKVTHGVEHYLPKDIYKRDNHRRAVMDDIIKSRPRLSKNGKFHAILATQSIAAAIDYYRMFRSTYPSLRVAAVFDNNIDNSDDGMAREDAIVEMLKDYNERYETAFRPADYALYKKDVALRLAHNKPYKVLAPEQQIDLLIVVSQMLTGYDSKWINTLYVDKKMVYVDIIQAFSRTNRLMDESKKFGIIKYYAYPYTMERNILDALEIYACSGFSVFVDKLEQNLDNINSRFLKISDIFRSHGINDFSKLPEPRETRNMFAKCFSEMSHLIDAAKMQGFFWDKKEYEFKHEGTVIVTRVEMLIDEETFLILRQRYKELFEPKLTDDGEPFNWEYAIDTYLTETGTGTIDAEYINEHFRRFVRELYTGRLTRQTVEQLCKSFASLSQRDQRTAGIILRDIQRGELRVEEGKSLQDYINEYQQRDLNGHVEVMSRALGIDYNLLKELCNASVDEQSINEFNRYGRLTEQMDRARARTVLENVYGGEVPARSVASRIDRLLRRFIFDADHDREDIIAAMTCEDRTLEDAAAQRRKEEAENRPLDTDRIIEQAEAATVVVSELSTEDQLKKIKDGVAAILSHTLAPVSRYMRSQSEVVDSVFNVLDRETGTDHDGVRMLIDRAFEMLFVKERPTIVDKHLAFHTLVTQFEAYLKKLYYMMEGRDVQPMNEGEPVTWKNVVYAVRCGT